MYMYVYIYIYTYVFMCVCVCVVRECITWQSKRDREILCICVRVCLGGWEYYT